MNSAATVAARTFSDALRSLDRHRLVRLLELRPDLRYPLPSGLADLAARATTTTSAARAIERMTAWQRLVCEGLAASPDPADVAELADLLAADIASITAGITDLRELGLCWGENDALHLVWAARDAWGPYPGGLAPPSRIPLDPKAIEEALTAVGPEAHRVLDRLVWGPPTGAVRNADRVVTLERAASPVGELLARRLLRPLDNDTVVLPREVARWLRAPAGLTRDPVSALPPALASGQREARLLTQAAAGAALEILHGVDLVLATVDAAPVRLLRTGGVGTRDVAGLSRTLDRDPAYAAFLLELLVAAGLIAASGRGTLGPTTGADGWAAQPTAERWRTLIRAWIELQRWPALAAAPGGHPLGPDCAAPRAAETRSLVFDQISDVPAGTVPELTALIARLRWLRPTLDRLGPELADVVAWIWREAEWLGLIALGGTSDLTGPVLDPERPWPADSPDLFPEPGEQLVVQSDLTAVAPGPLTSAVLSDLRRLADQESGGGGGVFRFSADSLRRAFDAGWTADQVHRWLTDHATTEIPQPLRYLIDDVGRRHGSVRVGSALSYVRCDDPAQAALLLTRPEAAQLGLRALAPGVLVCEAEPEDAVALLRASGLNPAAEDASGQLIPVRRAARSAPPAMNRAGEPVGAEAAADAILAAERQRPSNGPRDAAAEPDELAEALRRLREAAAAESAVCVRYLSGDGIEAEAKLNPLQLGAGMMRAVDAGSRRVVSIPLARISTVRPVRG